MTTITRPITDATGQIVPAAEARNNIMALLEKRNVRQAIKETLPNSIPMERFTRVVLMATQRIPRLLECTPASFMSALLQCSQLGLEPDNGLGHAWLVPYKNSAKNVTECQLIIGYQGFADLAWRTMTMSRLGAWPVFQGDEFQYERGSNEFIRHVEKATVRTPATLTHAWAGFKVRDGELNFLAMDVHEINAVRERAKARAQGPWVTDYIPMAAKTPFRRLMKFAPKSALMQRAIALDEQAEIGLPQMFDEDFEHVEELQTPVVSSLPSQSEEPDPTDSPMPRPHLSKPVDLYNRVREHNPELSDAQIDGMTKRPIRGNADLEGIYRDICQINGWTPK